MVGSHMTLWSSMVTAMVLVSVASTVGSDHSMMPATAIMVTRNPTVQPTSSGT